MKKSKYQFFEEIQDNVFLHYSALTNHFILLSKENHDLFESRFASIPEDSPLFKELKNGMFIVESNYDETSALIKTRQEWANGNTLYNLVINPTLDCNLSCWYCYENKIKGSKISSAIVDAIKKNIAIQYTKEKFECLKISFFGGEPFMEFEAIKDILDFAEKYCTENNIELIADFTTNATLIDKMIIEYLSRFRCHFQITLDGCEAQHNKVKIDKESNVNTYRKTIDALYLINKLIPNRLLAVRINFNNETLKGINSIIEDISFVDNRHTYLILKKVWQLPTKSVDKEALLASLQAILDKKFLVDYYLMPKGSLCFAERRQQVLINYDGGIFKCTTLCVFDKDNTLGVLDVQTGEIKWDSDKIEKWHSDMQRDYCKVCKWFPACMGICNRQLMAHPNEKICTFDACNLSEKEYLMYLFKYNLLYKEIYSK